MSVALAGPPEIVSKSPLDVRIGAFGLRLVDLSRSSSVPTGIRRELADLADEFYRIVRDLSAPTVAAPPPPVPPPAEPDAPRPRGSRVKGVRGRAWNRKPEGATRVCHACKIEKSIEQFAVRSDYGTRRGTCIDCYRDGQRLRYLSVERTDRLRTVLRFVLDGEDACAHVRCSICTARFRAGDEVAAFDLSLAHAGCLAAAEEGGERAAAG